MGKMIVGDDRKKKTFTWRMRIIVGGFVSGEKPLANT